MDRVVAAAFHYGDHVLVEDPTFPPILDLLDRYGCTAVAVPVDEEGLLPDGIAAALELHEPAGLILQPRSHNPYGHALTPRRLKAIAALVRDRDMVVVEDDHAAYISRSPAVSLGTAMPDRTVLIRSFSKSHGPDLRLAAVGGSGAVMERLYQRRLLGPAWSSRLLQRLLYDMLTDAEAIRVVAEAAAVYYARRVAMTSALAARGVEVPGTDGINLWVPVRDERSALLSLAVNGIAAAPGRPFRPSVRDGDHIRITCASVGSGVGDVADAIAQAATAAGSSPTR